LQPDRCDSPLHSEGSLSVLHRGSRSLDPATITPIFGLKSQSQGHDEMSPTAIGFPRTSGGHFSGFRSQRRLDGTSPTSCGWLMQFLRLRDAAISMGAPHGPGFFQSHIDEIQEEARQESPSSKVTKPIWDGSRHTDGRKSKDGPDSLMQRECFDLLGGCSGGTSMLEPPSRRRV